MKRLQSLIFLVLIFLFELHAQNTHPDLLRQRWNASWIAVPQTPAHAYGVYLFRKKFSLETIPGSFVVHVSADNRYKLFVNNKLVSLGPARGDLAHWNYETIDIATSLEPGNNIIAALVWNEGEMMPEAQISYRTAFILQGNSATEEIINTNSSWKCLQDTSYQPVKVTMHTYYVAGPGELVDMRHHVKEFQQYDYNDNEWKPAQNISPGTPKNVQGLDMPAGWNLVSSPLPQMELTMQRLVKLRRATGITVPASFPASATTINIPANTTAVLLLDQTHLTNAYPTIIFSKGKNAEISIGYAEALFTKYPSKGNRNEIDGKQFLGREDKIISDGTNSQMFTSLGWRTYRYLQVSITTKENPMLLNDIYGTFTGYPFQRTATFISDNKDLDTIFDIGWRTARLCAMETYMDCPYYEQLQYIGDSRIQALVSLYNSGDDRLLRNAINLMNNSRLTEGITLSRHPSHTAQLIPTFSLWYIGMLYDYYMYGADTNFIKEKLTGERTVLEFFHQYQQQDGSLKNVPYWNFTDWCGTKGWKNGTAPVGKDGYSAVMDLHLLWTYQVAADLESKIGMKDYVQLYQQRAKQLKQTIRQKYWDDGRKLYADRTEKDLFSQHANTLAILTGIVAGNNAVMLAKKIISDTAITQATIYYKYYLHQALIKAGMGDDYINWLDIWKDNIKEGMTTWAEISDINNSRSDCHAWGASPNIEFFRTVLGIDSDAPGFSKVKIVPHPGTMQNVSGSIPHPNGKLSVSYQLRNKEWNIQIMLPENITGYLLWKGKRYVLHSGENVFKF